MEKQKWGPIFSINWYSLLGRWFNHIYEKVKPFDSASTPQRIYTFISISVAKLKIKSVQYNKICDSGASLISISKGLRLATKIYYVAIFKKLGLSIYVVKWYPKNMSSEEEVKSSVAHLGQITHKCSNSYRIFLEHSKTDSGL